MNMEVVTTLMGSYAFPIVMCLMLTWYIAKEHAEHREELDELHEKHLTEMKTIAESLNNNTVAIKELTAYIGGSGSTKGG